MINDLWMFHGCLKFILVWISFWDEVASMMMPQLFTHFGRRSKLLLIDLPHAYPNLLGTKGFVVVVVDLPHASVFLSEELTWIFLSVSSSFLEIIQWFSYNTKYLANIHQFPVSKYCSSPLLNVAIILSIVSVASRTSLVFFFDTWNSRRGSYCIYWIKVEPHC